ncbi:pseudouridine kinase [Companilactobacillus sp. RD055328]|uniref:PfkB family carbohydrate kinase n=1 Tax=Companilactobacillus sp. RD055328 TaxID=2916634 RepID=UPI001FC7EE20|nr:PfkB family carbohydrate kinase [Companilactobacillus sp. RD055328]GKQ42133.1 pseudouridine kinase [Companilactobacillus sp. RD055328]
MDNDYVVIVGGLNLDLAGLCGNIYRERDSNIGDIKINVGGVGQNIAQNLTKLEVPSYLVTVYGDDYFGDILKTECQNENINLDYAEQIKGGVSSTYLYVTNEKGDMVTAINDMKIVEQITPEFLSKRIDFINNASICVIDGNISQESIEWLAQNCTAPIFADPVSIAKVGKFRNVLDKLDTFKPNELEAGLLTGIEVVDEDSAIQAAQALNDCGVKNVFISMGAEGILCSRDGEVDIVPTIAEKIISANGAGDCSIATITWASFYYKNALALKEVGQLTQAAASITLESEKAVSPDLSIRNVITRAKKFMEVV